jgi:hypothetical protein
MMTAYRKMPSYQHLASFLLTVLLSLSSVIHGLPASTSTLTSTLFSLRMLASIITRQQGVISSGASTSILESGVLSLALRSAIEQYPSHTSTLETYLDSDVVKVSTNLTKATANTRIASLDRFDIANALDHNPNSPL